MLKDISLLFCYFHPNKATQFCRTFIPNLSFQQAENFCNSIGILQQSATPSKFSGPQTPLQQEGEGMYLITPSNL